MLPGEIDLSTSEAVVKVNEECSTGVSIEVLPKLIDLPASEAVDEVLVQVTSVDAPTVVLSGLMELPESEAVDNVVSSGLMDLPESESVDEVLVEVGSLDVPTVVLPGMADLPTSEVVEERVVEDISVVEEDDAEGIHQGNPSHWLEYSSLMGNTLPLKSRVVYLKAYKELEDYLKKENQFVIGVAPSEHAMLNFFHYLKTVRLQAPSTIWYITFV